MAAKIATTKNNVVLPRAYAELLHAIGSFIQYWGFKEVHGQVWTCIFLAEEAIDANHIISQLKLSKAAISLAIKDLIEYRVIQEIEKTRPSTRKYISNPDLTEVILSVLRFREKQMLNIVVSAARGFIDTSKEDLARVRVSKAKIQKLKDMTECAQSVLDQVLVQDQVQLKELFGLLQCRE